MVKRSADAKSLVGRLQRSTIPGALDAASFSDSRRGNVARRCALLLPSNEHHTLKLPDGEIPLGQTTFEHIQEALAPPIYIKLMDVG